MYLFFKWEKGPYVLRPIVVIFTKTDKICNLFLIR